MTVFLRKAWILKTVAAAALALACANADAQAPDGPESVASPPPAAPEGALPLNASDGARLRAAVEAAQRGDVNGAKTLQASLTDPVARKLVQWAMIDSAGTMLSFYELDAARAGLSGWPRAARRDSVTEKAVEAAGLGPQRVVDWFGGREPQTAEGAMALAAAEQQLGRLDDARALILRTFREKAFEADAQARMIARFGVYLTPDDYAKRLDLLLYGQQGPATKALMELVTPAVRSLAEARIALRANRDDANETAAQVPAELQNAPGLAFERARYFRKRNLDAVAAGYVKDFPVPPAGMAGAAELVWGERRALMSSLLRSGDVRAAYAAVQNHGLAFGEQYTEAEFFAGWLALRKLNDPAAAAAHFANVEKAGATPITLSRALYWQGRAAEAAGDAAAAERYWREGAQYYTAFYGQLCADKIGQTTFRLPRDPTPGPADRARFEGRELVRAARMLADAGEKDAYRSFVMTLEETLPTAEELALLVDMTRLYGDQDLAMRVVRAGAQRGLYLPERGYPVRPVPEVAGAPEPALVFAITRQESGFDPYVRSAVGARGMMQLMPSTAARVAHRLGMGFSADRLNEPDYNMRLGAAYLGDLVQTFQGNYAMAAAAYNAGPGRPAQWATECGDPRGGTTDPSDFIECIPFAETRNYVMRIMEAVQIYRARLNGGAAPMAAFAELKRGGWGQPSAAPCVVASLGPAPCPATVAPEASGDASTLSAFRAETAPTATPYALVAQRIAAEDRAGEQPRIDVAARSDHHRHAAVEAKRAGKKGRKGKHAARFEHHAKVSKAKGHGGHRGGVRHHKASR